MRNTNLQAMIESAILAAFAMIIDILPLSLKTSNRRFHFICYDSYFYILLTAGALNQLS